MKLADVSILAGLVTATVTWASFFGSCTNWAQCRAPRPPSMPAPTKSEISVRRLNASLNDICEGRRLQAMFERSPCRAKDITQDQLSDSTPVGEMLPLVAEHSAELTNAIRLSSARIQREGDRASAPFIAAYERWDQERAARIAALLSARPSWADLNRERRQLARRLEQVLAETKS